MHEYFNPSLHHHFISLQNLLFTPPSLHHHSTITLPSHLHPYNIFISLTQPYNSWLSLFTNFLSLHSTPHILYTLTHNFTHSFTHLHPKLSIHSTTYSLIHSLHHHHFTNIYTTTSSPCLQGWTITPPYLKHTHTFWATNLHRYLHPLLDPYLHPSKPHGHLTYIHIYTSPTLHLHPILHPQYLTTT